MERSYATLAEKLAAFGIRDNELNLRNKGSRGRFTAVFLLQCLKALGSEWIYLPASLEEVTKKGGAVAGKGAAAVVEAGCMNTNLAISSLILESFAAGRAKARRRRGNGNERGWVCV